jgi:hypothetical protein
MIIAVFYEKDSFKKYITYISKRILILAYPDWYCTAKVEDQIMNNKNESNNYYICYISIIKSNMLQLEI